MKLKFKISKDSQQFARDEQKRSITAMIVREEQPGDDEKADKLVAKLRGTKPADMVAWGKRHAGAMVALCVVGYEFVAADGKPGTAECKEPNDAFGNWSAKARALATAFYGRLNGSDDGEIDDAFEGAEEVL